MATPDRGTQARHKDVKSLYHLHGDYKQLVERIRAGGGYSLGNWLPAFRHEVRPIYPGELLVVMGDTGTGKTAILQGLSLAARGYGDALMFQLELPGTLCFERYAAMISGMTQEEVFQAEERGEQIAFGAGDHVYVCDKPGLTLDDMDRIVADERKTGQAYDVVMVDYMGLVQGPGRGRYERTSEIAEQMKTFARVHDTIVILLSQIHRKDDDYVHDIGLHDAKDSGSIEAASDVLLGVYRDEDEETKLNIKILKNRKGRSGAVIEAKFDGARMRVTPWVQGGAWDPAFDDGAIGDE